MTDWVVADEITKQTEQIRIQNKLLERIAAALEKLNRSERNRKWEGGPE